MARPAVPEASLPPGVAGNHRHVVQEGHAPDHGLPVLLRTAGGHPAKGQSGSDVPSPQGVS